MYLRSAGTLYVFTCSFIQEKCFEEYHWDIHSVTGNVTVLTIQACAVLTLAPVRGRSAWHLSGSVISADREGFHVDRAEDKFGGQGRAPRK